MDNDFFKRIIMCNFTPSKYFGMEDLKQMLARNDVRGVVRTAAGEIIEFHNPGVKDLFEFVTMHPQKLEGALVADRVIGRGAALLLVLGQVKNVYAQVLSSPALQVLNDANINVDYGSIEPNIINRDGTDLCPVEKLTLAITDPEVAYVKIKEFLINKNIIKS